jgi:hypothetical protein
MGMAEYIAARFKGREICLDLDDESETIAYAEVWALNKEIFQGVVRDVVDGVLEFEMAGTGVIAINCDYIKIAWLPGVDWRQATKGSITKRPLTPNRR